MIICTLMHSHTAQLDYWLVYIPYELYEQELAALEAPAPETD